MELNDIHGPISQDNSANSEVRSNDLLGERIHSLECALREIQIWANCDHVYGEPRESAMRQISKRAFRALHLTPNAKADS